MTAQAQNGGRRTEATTWTMACSWCERNVYRHGAILLIVVLTLGSNDIEDGVLDREQVDCEKEHVEVGEKQERDKHKETTNARSNM